jgi:2',3'-cyclic-nucleotide 2'-phosphodiesterase (5'-nucleotidase family)
LVDTGHKQPKADLVKRNGPIFENWAKPQVAIVITGELSGYLEPCGCAGLENQKGGLSRRFSLLKQLTAQGWPLVPVDLGGLVHRQGPQAELKFQTAVEALRTMDYEAVGWGPDDLRLGAGLLLSATTDPDGKPSRFLAANVGLFELDLDSPDRFRVVSRGGRKIAVTAVLSKDFQKQVPGDDVKLADPVAALEKVVPKMAAAADTLVLLADASPKDSEQLARRFPQFRVVVTAGGGDEPPREPRRVDPGGALLIELGHKGMYAVTLGLDADVKRPIRYQRVPLDARFADSPEMKALMTAYQQQLRTLGWEGLGVTPVLNPRGSSLQDPAGHFAGSAACALCHKTAFDIWRKTPHAEATDTLVRLDPPRQFDPECVSCHVTGWRPQEFVPFDTGYTSIQATPQLKGNGCENCHGPGAGHIAAEAGRDIALRDKLRRLMRAPADESTCLKCHDLDNSPEFDFSTYWPQVEHHGKK